MTSAFLRNKILKISIFTFYGHFLIKFENSIKKVLEQIESSFFHSRSISIREINFSKKNLKKLLTSALFRNSHFCHFWHFCADVSKKFGSLGPRKYIQNKELSNTFPKWYYTSYLKLQEYFHRIFKILIILSIFADFCNKKC